MPLPYAVPQPRGHSLRRAWCCIPDMSPESGNTRLLPAVSPAFYFGEPRNVRHTHMPHSAPLNSPCACPPLYSFSLLSCLGAFARVAWLPVEKPGKYQKLATRATKGCSQNIDTPALPSGPSGPTVPPRVPELQRHKTQPGPCLSILFLQGSPPKRTLRPSPPPASHSQAR